MLIIFHITRAIKSTGWEVILALLIANVLAQLIKIILYSIKKKKFNTTLIFATGGMPSSHSSTVTAMATTVGLIMGWSSVIFAVAACFAGVVMFDAAGVRRNAGKQAKVLNEMIQALVTKGQIIQVEKLKEFLGHSPVEVLAGAALGMAISFGLHYFLRM